jgi:hypothetical protein
MQTPVLNATSRRHRRTWKAALAVAVSAVLSYTPAQAVIVPSSVLFGGGLYTYSYSVTNSASMFDLAIVNVPVGLGSNLQSLSAPLGFGIAFDPGVGIVSFFDDVDPATLPTFSPETTQGLFSFTSAFAPKGVMFDALDVAGTTFTGPTQAPGTSPAVPEAGETLPLLLFALAGMTLFSGWSRRRRTMPAGAPLGLAAALAVTAFLALGIPNARASSHSDAPLIKLDPQANLTDVYAFIRTRPSGERVLVVEVNVHPFVEPGDGLAYDAFSPDALYSIHLADPVTGAELQRYDFQFSPVQAGAGNYKNTNTILRYGRGANIGGAPDVGSIQTVGDAHQNFVQTYAVTQTIGGVRTTLTPSALLVAPPNVGLKTTPRYNDASGRAVSGATNRAALDPYTFQTTYDVPTGAATYTFFCGPRDDSFFADIPGISDLLDPRILGSTLGQAGGGVDGFKGFNVMHYSIVIPLAVVPSVPYTGALQPASTGVGVYASVSRPRLTLRQTNGPDLASGPYIQVNRLGNPLFNEALVALADKDNYNRTSPTSDAANFAKYALNPELAVLINATFGTTFQTTNRVDLKGIFIPDVVRVNTTTGAVRTAGEAGFNRLSFIGGDTVATNLGAGPAIPSGWPNGRRFGDDVVDIALTALASGPSFTTITIVGDNVPANDTIYNRTFPYAATPNSGTRNSKDSGVNVGF